MPGLRRVADLRRRGLLSLAALALSPPLHRGYVQTLEQSLLAGRVRLDSEEALDHTTQVTLAHTGHLERDTLLRQIAMLRGEEASLPPDAAIGDRSSLDALRELRSGQPAAVRSVLRAASPSRRRSSWPRSCRCSRTTR